MSEYPFNLKGQQNSFSGNGNRDGETWKSREFYLRQGIVVVEISHHGRGDFKLSFVATDGLSGGQATATGMVSGAIVGAAVGSIVPVVGTIAGGSFGAAAGAIFGEDVIRRDEWTPSETRGQFSTFEICQVAEGVEGALPLGKYRIEVESKAKWECRFIQPDLGQPQFSLTGDDEEDEEEMDAGIYVIGPCEPSRRPILADILHKGPGGLYACAFSIDGMHRCEIHYEEGQFYAEQVKTEIRAGKEYMLLVVADNEWNIAFREGY